MSNGRRDFLKFAGGSLVGLGFTPVPWKLLDDTSIWTQNWSWTPATLRGEISLRKTACTLCPRGCEVQIRCAGTQPVGIIPVKGTSLCRFGFTLHQAAYHPGRIYRGSPVADAAAFVRFALQSRRSVAVVDPAPGRIASGIYQRFAAEHGNVMYISDPAPRTLRAFEKLHGLPYRSAGLNLKSIRTLIAVDAPVLETWGPPGLLMRRRREVRLINSGTTFGITAELADEHVAFTSIEGMLSSIDKPAAVIGGEHLPWETQIALARMNRDLGAITFRPPLHQGAEPTPLPSIPEASIDVLIVEGAGIPLASLRSKLKPGCTMLAFSAFTNEYTAAAKHVISSAAPLEGLEDIASSFDADANSIRLTVPITHAPERVHMASFVAGLDSGPSYEQIIESRLRSIHASGRGSARGTKLDEFIASMKDGALWTDSPASMPPVREHTTTPEAPAPSSDLRLLAPPPLIARFFSGAIA